jgi:hypothetical protein
MCITTNSMHCLLLIYQIKIPLHISLTPGGSTTAHVWLTPGGSSTVHIWLTPGGSNTVHIGLTPGGSSTVHIGLTPGGSNTVHIGLTPGGSSTVHIWLTPGGSSTVHNGLTPGGSSTVHIWLTPGGSSTVHIGLTPGGSSTVHIYTEYRERNTHTVDPRVTTGLTYDQLGLRPKFLFWLTTKCRVTTRASANVASTYPVSRAVHCERSRCLLCFAGATTLIPLKSMYSINKYRVTEKGWVSLTARSSINRALRPTWRS